MNTLVSHPTPIALDDAEREADIDGDGLNFTEMVGAMYAIDVHDEFMLSQLALQLLAMYSHPFVCAC
jgi:hypothetical protein